MQVGPTPSPEEVRQALEAKLNELDIQVSFAPIAT